MPLVHRRAALLALLLALPVAADPVPFRDVTRESGVADSVDRHYAAVGDWWLSGLTLADLDGDGRLDLHLGSHSGPAHPAALFRNAGGLRFTAVGPELARPRGPKARGDLPYPGGEVRLAFDVDEDGRLDLLCSWHDGGGALYLNAPAPGQPPAPNFARDDRLDPFSRATLVADLDGDGLVDYVVDDRAALRVFRGTAPGQFAAKPVVIPGGLKEGGGGIPLDIDGDGKPDLLISQRGYNPAGRRILHNDTATPGDLRFSDATRAAGLDPDGGSIHGAGDLNGDGHPDLICVERDRLVIYLNDGKGHFTARPDAIRGWDKVRNRPHYANWGGAVVTDIDNDGIPDILVNGRYFFYVLHGQADGTWTVTNDTWGLPTTAWTAVDEGLCFGDLDGDGRLDLVTCAGTDKRKAVAVWHNEMPARRWVRVRPVGKPGNRSATGAVIRLYAPNTAELLATEYVAVWGRQSFHSYYAATRTERHFGLGDRDRVDVAVTFASGKVVKRPNVAADRAVEIPEE